MRRAASQHVIIYTPERCGWCGPAGGPMEEGAAVAFVQFVG